MRYVGLAVSLLAAMVSVVLTTSQPALALAGDLDPGFSAGGLILEGTPPGHLQAVTTQPDDKIVVAGSAWRNGQIDIQVIRYLPDGRRDTSFGTGGRVLSDMGRHEGANAVAVQPDGKIVVGGNRSADFSNPRDGQGLVARYNADGTLDTTFGTGGWVLVDTALPQFGVRSVVVQLDGALLVAGYGWIDEYRAVLVRLHPDGSVDTAFTNGRPADVPAVYLPVPMNVAGAGLLADGRIVVAGSTSYHDPKGAVAVRLTGAGAVDTTFGDGGVAHVPMGSYGFAYDMALLPDGGVVLVGDSSPSLDHKRFAVARLTPEGRPDLAFGIGGELLASVGDAQNATATAVAMAPDGSLFVGGWASAGPGGQPYSECRRHTTRDRWFPMSVFRLASRRRTSLCPTAATGRRSLVRNAVTATDSASLGSVLSLRPLPRTRVRAARVAGTFTTCSPVATSCWASR